MKKIFAIMIVIALVFTLCSCKKDNNNVYSESPLSSSGSDTSSESLESNISENTSHITSGDGQSTTSNSNESVSGKENNTNYKESNDIPVEKAVYITADTSRAPSTDIGSIISNGYIYYTNPDSSFPDGLFRKKISGGTEEKVTDMGFFDYKVLDETVYFIHQSNLYRCDTNGGNVKKLFDNIMKFEVAGNWIFATRKLGQSSIGHPIEELYVISTDGSVAKRIKLNVSNNAGSIVEILGFNRGYCYLTIDHFYYISGQHYYSSGQSPTINIINTMFERAFIRIDYRSKDLIQHEFKRNAEYIYEGSKQYEFVESGLYITNDHVIQRMRKTWAVSLLNNTAVTIYEQKTSSTQLFLKDYFVYIPHDYTINNFKVIFVNYDGGEKTYTFDWSNMNITYCQPYYSQDAYGNLLLVRFENSNTKEYYLKIIDSNGQVTDIYKKSK